MCWWAGWSGGCVESNLGVGGLDGRGQWRIWAGRLTLLRKIVGIKFQYSFVLLGWVGVVV